MKIDIKKITDKEFFKYYNQAINLLELTTEEEFLSFKDNCFYGSRDDIDCIFYDNDGLTFIITEEFDIIYQNYLTYLPIHNLGKIINSILKTNIK
jgi:hypothetical protein